MTQEQACVAPSTGRVSHRFRFEHFAILCDDIVCFPDANIRWLALGNHDEANRQVFAAHRHPPCRVEFPEPHLPQT